MDDATKAKLLQFQRNEITEYHVYKRLAQRVKNPDNAKVLTRIAADELRHYNFWREYTQASLRPSRWLILKYTWIARLLGVTFAIKLMERGEAGAKHDYAAVLGSVPAAQTLADEEEEHEQALIEKFDEEILRYTGSVVLGINDALVELTGALAGLTLALQDGKQIALVGSVTGIAASLSMGASEYLSTQTEATDKRPIKAAVYTTVAYLFTVIALIVPFILLQHTVFVALAVTMSIAIGIIFMFNYYVSVAQDQPFRRRFIEMAVLSLTVAALSFGVGFLLRIAFGIEAD